MAEKNALEVNLKGEKKKKRRMKKIIMISLPLCTLTLNLKCVSVNSSVHRNTHGHTKAHGVTL